MRQGLHGIGGLSALAGGFVLGVLLLAGDAAGATKVYNPPLRVCADPNNMPYSDKAGEGFENKLAEMVAKDMDTSVSYVWHAQRRGFLRETLNAYECDVVMGVPQLGELATTRSYYRSSYVFLSRADRNLTFSSMNAPELKTLRIGVHLVGDDGANTPPADALGRQGIFKNVIGYTVYGDYRDDAPPSALVKAVADGDVDLAALWGPIAGYFAQKSNVKMRIVPITDTAQYLPSVFQFPISMGVRSSDKELRDRLDAFINDHQDEIDALLKRYGVPLV